MILKYSVRAVCSPDGLLSGGFSIPVEAGLFGAITPSLPDGEWSRCIAIPGLIQSHLHLGQTLFRGMAEGRTLLPWLEERIWPLEASHDGDTLAVSVILSLRELFSGGCTGLVDMGTLSLSAITVDILRRSGVRALAGNALMDIGPDWISRDLGWLKEESERVRRSCGGLVGYVYAPRFALSCSDEVWHWMAALPPEARRTTHAAEAPGEMSYSAIGAAGGNIRFLRDRGFTGPNTLLAHCVHLEQGELEILAGSDTSVVHCPWANLKLGSGIADVPALVSSGICVLIGSDGAACNNRLDAAGDARLGMALSAVKAKPSALPGDFWMNSITSAAAKAIGWNDTGAIMPGMSADMTLLELAEDEWDELDTAEDQLRYRLEIDWSSRIRLTINAGVTVFRDGEYPTLPPLPLGMTEARSRVLDRAARLKDPLQPVSSETIDG